MKKQKISYAAWKAILNRVAEKRGYLPRAIQAGFDSSWKPFYEKGLTPLEAWGKV